MKRTLLTISAAAFLFASCNNDTKSESAKTDDSKKDTASTTKTETKSEAYTMPDSATMMKNWQAYMTPGEPHKMLAKSNGVWNCETTFWQMPGAPPQTSSGTMTNKMVMDGRYQVSNFKGTMMGAPFEGMGTVAYDNAKKVYISTWIDNMGTGLMSMEGTWDDASKSLTLKGRVYEPASAHDIDMKEVFKIIDDNNQVMEMYAPGPDGKEFKNMEIKLTRKK